MQRVKRDNLVRDVEFFEQSLGRGDFVGFFVDFDVRENQRRIGGKDAQNLPRSHVVERIEAAAQRLAIQCQRACAEIVFIIVQLRGVLPERCLNGFGVKALKNETDCRVGRWSPPRQPKGLVQFAAMNFDERANAAIRIGSRDNG
ncbi:MAG: hypothetical protein PHX43_00445 [Alphaproteobacteria bacterium]|nr:hypothetical protein [Alphaproteobacteria bacterium]